MFGYFWLGRNGDIEQNLWPKPNSCQIFSVCHWNLNNTLTYNFVKLSLLRPNITIYNILNLKYLILDFQKYYYLVTLPLTIQKTYILNTTTEYIVSSKRWYVPFCYSFWGSCMAVLFTSYCFFFIFIFFLLFFFSLGCFLLSLTSYLHLFIM